MLRLCPRSECVCWDAFSDEEEYNTFSIRVIRVSNYFGKERRKTSSRGQGQINSINCCQGPDYTHTRTSTAVYVCVSKEDTGYLLDSIFSHQCCVFNIHLIV